ncbi:hypothetical protein [Nocardia brasiliensis]|uniref:hypothetical protein n=1 Tax=Nocardia brasiliensis TaxID=37326 RepID=UPI00366BF820
MYDELVARRKARRGSRDGHEKNTHPETKRTYMFRGMLLHGCNRRMFGTSRHGDTYYLCWPTGNNRGRPDKYAGHPKTVYIREDAVLDAVSRFFTERVFGEHRRDLLAADLAGVDDHATRQRHIDQERLQRTIADVTRRQNAVLRQAQDGDPDDPFTKALRGTYNNLETEKSNALATIAQLNAADNTEPGRPAPTDIALLDALPYLTLNLAEAPEPLLRRLFEVTQLNIHLQDDGRRVTITIKLPADELPQVAHAAASISSSAIATQEPPRQTTGSGTCVDAVRAPRAARTASTTNRVRGELRISAEFAINRRRYRVAI